MQLKMEKTKTPVKTPKSNKTSVKTPKSNKTPKKVDLKQTSLKKEGTPNTPKSNDKTPKPSPKVAQKQQQKQTPQKDQKQNYGKGDKTPQSKPGTPKTPESHSKKSKPRMRSSNKKQKLNDTTSKKIQTGSKGGPTVTVNFPKGLISPEEFLPVFEGCEGAFLSQVMLKFTGTNVSKKIEELKKKRIRGKPINISFKSNVSLLKKAIRLPSPEHKEEARKFFNAKSIDIVTSRFGLPSKIFVLTFKTEKEAEIAANKEFTLAGRSITLMPYFERHGAAKGKVESAKKEKDNTGAKQNEAKKQVKTPPKQVKRKVEEEEEEGDDDDDDDEEFGSDDMMDNIDMDDDDDDDDDEDDDDE